MTSECSKVLETAHSFKNLFFFFECLLCVGTVLGSELNKSLDLDLHGACVLVGSIEGSKKMGNNGHGTGID